MDVNFIKIYKALHEAGYNVLTYDMRNHGRSGAANANISGAGLLEYRDVVGAMGLSEHLDVLDEEQVKCGGFTSFEMSPHNYAMNVKIPTFIIQVHDDVWTKPEDVQKTFDLIPGNDKKLFWIQGTTVRFDGYNYFGENPQQMLEWFDKHMK